MLTRTILMLAWVALWATGCGDSTAMVVKVSAGADVPGDLTAVRLEVHQRQTLLQAKTFELQGKQLPQRVRLVTHGSTAGEIEVRAQGLRRERLEATGSGRGTLWVGRSPPEIELELALFCTEDGGCGCTPATCQELGATCGLLDAGCLTTRDCGSCTLPDTCGGGGEPHQCGRGCVPECTACGELKCGSPCLTGSCPSGRYCDAGSCACAGGLTECGGECIDPTCTACGELKCGSPCLTGSCPSGRYCDAGSCACAGGLSECGGKCVDLENDPNNCGQCGRACPNGKACNGGLCLCMEPSDDSDKHCCLPGMTLTNDYGQPRCWSSVRGPASSQVQALADCATFRVGGGMACPGGTPLGACGYFLTVFDRSSRVDLYGKSGWCGGGSCDWICAGGCGTCSACASDGGCNYDCHLSRDCRQQYFCSMRPLGPTYKLCQNDEHCPPGRSCDKGSGTCRPSSRTSCCWSADCDGGSCLVGSIPPWVCR